jgi:ABC-type Fe3+-hydroxamate transport system substrate-binding protein
MEELGIDVAVHDPRSIAGALADAFKIGTIMGRKHYARDLLQGMRKQIEAAEQGIDKHPKVMLILGASAAPRSPSCRTAGAATSSPKRAAADRRVSSGSGFERISDEVVVAENPDIIIAVPHANEADIPSLTEYLRSNPAWSSTNAARSGRVYISVDNSLLQAGTDIARTIRKVRSAYLKN